MSKKIIIGNPSGTGIGFFGLLTVVLIVLKLTKHITCSWFWVFGVITIPVSIIVIGFLIWFIFGNINEYRRKIKKRKVK